MDNDANSMKYADYLAFYTNNARAMRAEATERARDAVLLTGMMQIDVADIMGIDRGACSKFLSKKADLAFDLNAVEKLASRIIRMRPCELFFGEQRRFPVPKMMQMFVSYIRDMDQQELEELTKNIRDGYEKLECDSEELVYIRLSEYMRDRGYRQIRVQEEGFDRAHLYCRPWYLTMDAAKKMKVGVTPFLIVCQNFDLSPDYLLLKDYVKYGLVMAPGENGKQKLIEKRLCQACSAFAVLTESAQQEVLAVCFKRLQEKKAV